MLHQKKDSLTTKILMKNRGTKHRGTHRKKRKVTHRYNYINNNIKCEWMKQFNQKAETG